MEGLDCETMLKQTGTALTSGSGWLNSASMAAPPRSDVVLNTDLVGACGASQS